MMNVFQQTKYVLGSDALLTVVTDSAAHAAKILADLWRQIDVFEARFSRFRTDSELTYCNTNAGQKVPISPEFFAILSAARRVSADTNGLYNPFILPALQQAGYAGSWPEPSKPLKGLDYTKRSIKSIDALVLGNDWVRIPKDSALDLGGIGKGYLLDQLAETVGDKLQGFWFSLGGDIVCQGLDADGKPWRLLVRDAERSDVSVAYVENTSGEKLSLATSGVTKRVGKKGERAWHHLIDPRTGYSSESDVLTASVAMPSSTLADVYASCVVLLGSAKTRQFLAERGAAGLAQTVHQTAHSAGIITYGVSFTVATNKQGSLT